MLSYAPLEATLALNRTSGRSGNRPRATVQTSEVQTAQLSPAVELFSQSCAHSGALGLPWHNKLWQRKCKFQWFWKARSLVECNVPSGGFVDETAKCSAKKGVCAQHTHSTDTARICWAKTAEKTKGQRPKMDKTAGNNNNAAARKWSKRPKMIKMQPPENGQNSRK